MPVLTNHSGDFQMLNLGFSRDGRGPYALRQTGYAPGSTALQQDIFFLRRDGTWVLNLAAFILPEKELEEHFFYRDIQEIVEVIDRISAKPLSVEDRLPEGKTREEVMAGLQSTASSLISRMREAKASRFEA